MKQLLERMGRSGPRGVRGEWIILIALLATGITVGAVKTRDAALRKLADTAQADGVPAGSSPHPNVLSDSPHE